MFNTKTLVLGTITLIALFSISTTAFAKIVFPDDMRSIVTSVEVVSEQDSIEVNTLITEDGSNNKYVTKAVSELVNTSNLQPIKNNFEFSKNDKRMKDNLQERIKMVKAKVRNMNKKKISISQKRTFEQTKQENKVEEKKGPKLMRDVNLVGIFNVGDKQGLNEPTKEKNKDNYKAGVSNQNKYPADHVKPERANVAGHNRLIRNGRIVTRGVSNNN